MLVFYITYRVLSATQRLPAGYVLKEHCFHHNNLPIFIDHILREKTFPPLDPYKR